MKSKLTYIIYIGSSTGRMAIRGLHQSKPAMQVMATNPLRATEATVSFIFVLLFFPLMTRYCVKIKKAN